MGRFQLPFSLLTDESFNTVDYGINKVSSIASWSFEDDNTQMADFKKSYTNLYQSSPRLWDCSELKQD